MIFFILVGGAPGTIWDHIKLKNGPKKGSKNSQKRAKIGLSHTPTGRRIFCPFFELFLALFSGFFWFL